MNSAPDESRLSRWWSPRQRVPAALLAVIVVLSFAPEAWQLALRFDRVAVTNGQVWRLLTGNLVHLGFNHMAMNAAGLVLIWVIFSSVFTPARWLVVIVVSSLCVTGGLMLFNPSLVWYVGLSGTLHGLFILGLVLHLRRGYRLEWLLLFLIAAKLAWEQVAGALPGSADMAGGPVVVDAHLYGAVGGALTAVLLWLYNRFVALAPKHD